MMPDICIEGVRSFGDEIAVCSVCVIFSSREQLDWEAIEKNFLDAKVWVHSSKKDFALTRLADDSCDHRVWYNLRPPFACLERTTRRYFAPEATGSLLRS